MSSTLPPELRQARAEAQKAKAERLQQEALEAREEYEAIRAAEEAKTAHLRALRMARDEAEKLAAAEDRANEPVAAKAGSSAKAKTKAKAKAPAKPKVRRGVGSR